MIKIFQKQTKDSKKNPSQSVKVQVQSTRKLEYVRK